MSTQRVSIIGAGWAGLAAAIAACEAGHQVHLYEATQQLGGRARSLPHKVTGWSLDNGQHILIGAYSATLGLMRQVGLNPNDLLLRLPLNLRFPDHSGVALPPWPAPWHALWGIARAAGWSWADKWPLLQACVMWQAQSFTCPSHWTVADLTQHHGLSEHVVQGLIEPLCVSALNTPLGDASARVFLRVLHDALLGGKGSSDLLIPTVDLQQLLPSASEAWLRARGVHIHLGTRISHSDMSGQDFTPTPKHAVVLATPAWEAARLLGPEHPKWAQQAQALSHLAIATVYLRCHDPGFTGLGQPLLALRSNAHAPAQFVFCRTQLMQQTGVLACVVSACTHDRITLERLVVQQVQQQLGWSSLEVLQTVIEKRAAFACTPDLQRPPSQVAPHLWACGDYVAGPYPATLEGAVRSGLQVVAQL